MKRIVIDARESGTTTGRYVDKLIEYLHKLQPRFEIVIVTKTHRVEFFKQLVPDFTVVETPFKEFTFGEQLGFKRQLQDLKADLIHFTMVQQPVLYRGAVVTTMQDLTGIRFKDPSKNPIIYVVKQQIYRWVNKEVAHKSVALITPSEFVRDDIVNFTHVSPDKITVTYEAADHISDTAKPVTVIGAKRFIMYVGRPMPHKNLERLIEAFVILRSKQPDIYLVLAGKKDVNYAAIEQSITARKIKNVIFTDFVSEGQLRWLYEHCSAYVFPSLSEGFGLPGLEAMMHGAPVASSHATCLPEIYGKAAHYFDPLDTSAIAESVAEVLNDTSLQRKLIATGKKQAAKYSWQRMAEQTLDVYKQILK